MRIIPRRLIKNIVGFSFLSEILKSQAFQVKRLGVDGVFVSKCQTLNSNIAVIYTFAELTVFKAKASHRSVASYIACITLYSLKIIVLWFIVMLFVLFQMQTVYI